MNSQFSPVIAGTMLWGSFGRKLNTHDMAHLIRHCVLNGIHTFDHADIYGGYTTEADFGTAWVASEIKRSDIQLISKCGINMICDARPFKTGHYDHSMDHIIRQCEASLTHLATDYLDLLLIHRPSPLMDPHVVAEAATKLKEQGKILAFGVANFTPSQTDLLRQLIPVEYNQIEFSVTHHSPLTDGSLDHMMLHKIRPMAWGPMGTVFKHQDEQSRRVRKVTAELAKKYEVEEDTILLAWIHAHPSGIIPVVGTADELRISKLRQSLEVRLELEEWFTLYQAGMGHPVP
mgnify:FL=1